MVKRMVAATTAATLMLVLVGVPASAQTPAPFPCGKVTAYTPPTATATGSLTLGTNTFVLAAGSARNPPPPVPVGALVCLAGERDASGAFLLNTTLVGDTVCGSVVASTPASATSPGSLTFSTQLTILVAPGVTLTSAQLRDQCYRFGFNADGNAHVTGHIGPPLGGPRQLPSTATSTDAVLGILLPLIVLLGGLASVLKLRSGRSPSSSGACSFAGSQTTGGGGCLPSAALQKYAK